MKTKLLSAALLAAAWLAGGSVWAQSEPEQDSDGWYLLGSVDDVEWFGDQVLAGHHTIKGKLTADIDYEGVTNAHKPIGNDTHKFIGHFDGQGHRIKNMILNNPTSAKGVGFFGSIRGGGDGFIMGSDTEKEVNLDVVIKNLIIDSSCSISSNQTMTAGVVGRAANSNTGHHVTIENCINEADVTCTQKNVAGILGTVDGTNLNLTIKNCANLGKINGATEVSQKENAAICGWTGKNNNTNVQLTGCWNIGEVVSIDGNGYNLFRVAGSSVIMQNNYDLNPHANGQQGRIDWETEKPAESGELCYVLNSNQSPMVWYQQLDQSPADSYPLPFYKDDATVYRVADYNCDGVTPKGSVTYSNTDAVTRDPHTTNSETGICTTCNGPDENWMSQEEDGFYHLSTPVQVEWFSAMVAAGYGAMKVKLDADIDFGGVENAHMPIGTADNKFFGVFDGQKHSIKGMVLNLEQDGVGFFGHIQAGGIYKGIDYSETSFTNVIIDGTCSVTSTGARCGGLIGRLNGALSSDAIVRIEYCGNEANVNAGGQNAAGLMGGIQSTTCKLIVRNCYNTGNITANIEATALVGWTGSASGENVIVERCWNNGIVSPLDVDGRNLYRSSAAITASNLFDLSNTEGAKQGKVIFNTENPIASGELCYLLNGDQSNIAWTQNLGDEEMPNLWGATSQVYQQGTVNCIGAAVGEVSYNNVSGETIQLGHNYENGICSVCKDFQAATQAEDGWYELANAGNIEWMSNVIQQNAKGADNVAYAQSKFRMMNDIDFTDVTHTKIGQTETYKFDGTFDGQCHRITNLKMNEPNATSVGFFGYCRGEFTLIKNLIIDESCSFYGNDRVAALVGSFQRGVAIVNIENCVNEASVTAKSKCAAGFVGGQANNNDTPRLFITNCINVGTITVEAQVSGNDCAAAIIANYNSGGDKGGNSTLTNCVNIGHVSPLNGFNTMFTGGYRSYFNCYDITEGKMNNQNTPLPSFVTENPVTSGELCFYLNNNQSEEISYTQTLSGDNIDTYPVPFNNHDIVYQNADYLCPDVTSGGVSFANTNASTGNNTSHTDSTKGFCIYCNKVLPEHIVADTDSFFPLASVDDVEWFSAMVAAGNLEINGKLMNDIDFDNVENAHNPIGPNEQNKFNGTFDGQGFRIKNMIIERPTESNVGFFGWLRGNNAPTTVKNLIIDNSCSVHGYNRVGGVTGTYQNGGSVITIENVINEATVTAEHQDAGGFFGGHQAGNPTIIIRNCMNTGTITAKNEHPYAGAICCYLGVDGGTSVIENFVNLGTIVGHEGGNMGRYNISNVTNLIDLSDTDPDGSTAAPNAGLDSGLEKADITNGKLAYTVGWGQLIGTDENPSPLNDTEVSYVGEAGYATMYDTTTGYTLNGDVKAHVVTTHEVSGYLKLTEIENVPAETPVVLKGTYYNKLAKNLAAINIANELKGAAADTEADGTMYILANGSEGVGFYKAEVGSTIAAGKAYYQNTSGVKAFFFDGDDATSINEELRIKNEESSIFNIAGQKLTKMQKGINIVNGKKILF